MSFQMLSIHERRECGIPVIIEGETGVGKTALINMLSKLWNHALINELRSVKKRISDLLPSKSLGMYLVHTYVVVSCYHNLFTTKISDEFCDNLGT